MAGGAAAMAWPRFALSQAKPRHLGLLHVGADHVPPSFKPMREAMTVLGYRDGVNVRYDLRNEIDEKAGLVAARELVKQRAEIIIAFDPEACSIAHVATDSIPIVMVHVANPVAAGFAVSLARPGGNMTGFAGRALLLPKEMELLKELAPRLKRALLLFDSGDKSSLAAREESRKAAAAQGITLLERDIPNPASLQAVFSKIKPKEAEAVLIASNVIRHRYQKPLLALATERGIAMIGARRDFVLEGALFTYSYDFTKVGDATAGRYIDPILKGAKPGDLPIEEVTDYKLVVNRAVIARHGWTIPPTFELRGAEIVG
jgi:putative ABC transport system substrate-binding protein